MKSENALLSVCLVVVFIAIGGLTVQGCRSTKMQKTVHEQMDSVGQNSRSREVNNDSLLRLLKKNKWALKYQIEYYTPIMDSTGRVIGNLLARKESVQVDHEESSDSIAETKRRTVEKQKSEAAVKRDLKEKVDEEKKTRASPALVIMILLGCVLLTMFVRKKILPRFFN